MLPYKILSTKLLSPSVKTELPADIDLTELEMINIKPIRTADKIKEIEKWLTTKLPMIFTSANAAEIIIQTLKKMQLDVDQPTIYSLAGKTFDVLNQFFPTHTIHIANNATMLAERIIYDKVKELVFFCGDIRRDELPDALYKNNVRLHELIVYETIETPSKIESHYDAILFFSPSGVRSFFAVNKLEDSTVCFAIGSTTANTISEYTQNKIIESKTPDPLTMISEVAAFFKTRLEHGIKE